MQAHVEAWLATHQPRCGAWRKLDRRPIEAQMWLRHCAITFLADFGSEIPPPTVPLEKHPPHTMSAVMLLPTHLEPRRLEKTAG
jgi:hypothetical protein